MREDHPTVKSATIPLICKGCNGAVSTLHYEWNPSGQLDRRGLCEPCHKKREAQR